MIRNCSGAAILVRTVQFRLSASTIDSCDVAVEVAEMPATSFSSATTSSRTGLGVASGQPATFRSRQQES